MANWREYQYRRSGRGGIDPGYSGRYAGRREGGFTNYSGRPGGVSGGHYGAYEHTYDNTTGRGRYGGQYEGLSPGFGADELHRSAERVSRRGRGPRGYTRSDNRIREDVCDYLTDDPYLDANDIDVQVKEGEVILSGTVSSRGAKRHAEEIAEQASGVRNVQNSLRVKEQSHEPPLAGRTAGTSDRPE